MKFYRNIRLATAVVAVGAMAALAGCSTGGNSNGSGNSGGTSGGIEIPGATAEQTQKANALYDAAVKSGNTEITFYGPSASTSKALTEVFTQRFPKLTVALENKSDADILTTMQTEAATGKRIGDLWWGGDSVQAAKAGNLCTPIDIFTGPAGWQPPKAENDQLIYFAFRPFGFVYNTNLLKAGDLPKGWKDLLDPKWKGKIAMGDPNAGALRHIFTGMMRPDGQKDKFGESFVTAFAGQDLQYVDPERNVASEVASGRFPIGVGVFMGYYLEQKDKGAPLGFIFPLEGGGNFFSRSSVCVTKDGPSSDATALFINWLFTDEGQKALAEKDNSYGNTPTAPGPIGLAALDKVEKLPFASSDSAFNKPFFDFIEKTFKNPNKK